MVKIWNNKPEKWKNGEFFTAPKSFFSLKLAQFKLMCWLYAHEDGFEFNQYFIRKGTGMDYRTIRDALLALNISGMITISGKITTNSKFVIYNSGKNVTK